MIATRRLVLSHRHRSYLIDTPPTRRLLLRSTVVTTSGKNEFSNDVRHRPSTLLRDYGTNNALFSSSTAISLFSTTSPFSTAVTPPDFLGDDDEVDDYYRPHGDLFDAHRQVSSSHDLVGKSASIRRVFEAGANAQGLLSCGGEALARHASFDPNYHRARSYIQTRPIGPAVVSSVLIGGMIGALVEAALPQSVSIRSTLDHVTPLIVGVHVLATVKVTEVQHVSPSENSQKTGHRQRHDGYDIQLRTEVVRTQDGAVIAKGNYDVWVPSLR